MNSSPQTILVLSADWWSAIGTIAAVVVALVLAGKQSRDTLRRERQIQAEKITAWLDFSTQVSVRLRVRNASDQLIYDLVAQAVSVQGAFRTTAVLDTEERNREFGALIGNVPPGETVSEINTGGGGMHLRFAVEIAFRDAAGRFWLREGDGTIKEVKQHPLDLYNLSRPVGWER